IEVGGHLDDSGTEDLRLVDDLGVDLEVPGLQVEALHEAPVVGANHSRDRRQASLRGEREQAVGGTAQPLPGLRDRADLSPLHVWRGDHHLGTGLHDRVREQADVLGAVTEVAVERDHEVATSLIERIAKGLPEVEVGAVAEEADAWLVPGELFDDLRRAITRPVVDDDDLPGVPVLDPLQVVADLLEGLPDHGLLVVRGTHHRDHLVSPIPLLPSGPLASPRKPEDSVFRRPTGRQAELGNLTIQSGLRKTALINAPRPANVHNASTRVNPPSARADFKVKDRTSHSGALRSAR